MSRQELLEKIDVLLGGRAAEMIIFEDITTGAQNDLQRATEIARSMVTLYGMTDKLGPVTYQRQANPFMPQQQPNFFPAREVSEETSRMIDDEVRSIIEARLEGVLNTHKEHEDLLHLVAERLLVKETIEEDEFRELIAKKDAVKAVAGKS
jgi:cell division protease FtsH